MSLVITLDDLESYLPSTTTIDDDLGQLVVDGVNSWIDTQTSRCFGTTNQVTERYSWGRTTWLRHSDIVSIDAVNLGLPGQTASLVNPTGYYFDPLGRLTSYSAAGSSSPFYRDYMSVQYTYGVMTVPDDLKLAALGIASGMYNWASNGNRDVAAVSVGTYQIQYTNKRSMGSTSGDPATSTADANWAVIQSYKLRRT